MKYILDIDNNNLVFYANEIYKNTTVSSTIKYNRR